jgi:hypothetical protein
VISIRSARPDEAGVMLSLVREFAEHETLSHEVEATESMMAAAVPAFTPLAEGKR